MHLAVVLHGWRTIVLKTELGCLLEAFTSEIGAKITKMGSVHFRLVDWKDQHGREVVQRSHHEAQILAQNLGAVCMSKEGIVLLISHYHPLVLSTFAIGPGNFSTPQLNLRKMPPDLSIRHNKTLGGKIRSCHRCKSGGSQGFLLQQRKSSLLYTRGQDHVV